MKEEFLPEFRSLHQQPLPASRQGKSYKIVLLVKNLHHEKVCLLNTNKGVNSFMPGKVACNKYNHYDFAYEGR